MNIIVKKTLELSETEQYAILLLFNTIFKKNEKIEYFRNKYFNTVLRYSYHSILYDNNLIVGCWSYIPSNYRIKDECYLSAVGVDLMISKEYEGQGYFQDMFFTCIDYMRNDKVIFILGFPNDISYPLTQKLKLLQDIGKLSTYALPYHIGGIIPGLKIFNLFSAFLVNIYLFLTSFFASAKIHHFIIEKESEAFNRLRYNYTEGNYYIRNIDECGFVYKFMNFEGIRAAVLIDVFVKSSKNYNKAVKHIIRHHHKEMDILLYVGNLPFKYHGLIKVPKFFSRKNFHFQGRLLHEEKIEKDLLFNLDNWDINLSNYDLV